VAASCSTLRQQIGPKVEILLHGSRAAELDQSALIALP
jgi:hypothetical protein